MINADLKPAIDKLKLAKAILEALESPHFSLETKKALRELWDTHLQKECRK